MLHSIHFSAASASSHLMVQVGSALCQRPAQAGSAGARALTRHALDGGLAPALHVLAAVQAAVPAPSPAQGRGLQPLDGRMHGSHSRAHNRGGPTCETHRRGVHFQRLHVDHHASGRATSSTCHKETADSMSRKSCCGLKLWQAALQARPTCVCTADDSW